MDLFCVSYNKDVIFNLNKKFLFKKNYVFILLGNYFYYEIRASNFIETAHEQMTRTS